jgi:hypothetical protein
MPCESSVATCYYTEIRTTKLRRRLCGLWRQVLAYQQTNQPVYLSASLRRIFSCNTGGHLRATAVAAAGVAVLCWLHIRWNCYCAGRGAHLDPSVRRSAGNRRARCARHTDVTCHTDAPQSSNGTPWPAHVTDARLIEHRHDRHGDSSAVLREAAHRDLLLCRRRWAAGRCASVCQASAPRRQGIRCRGYGCPSHEGFLGSRTPCEAGSSGAVCRRRRSQPSRYETVHLLSHSFRDARWCSCRVHNGVGGWVAGKETFRIVNDLVDGMITVSNDEVRC